MNRSIVVFGSNLQGHHGLGAALFAKNNCGAEMGIGVGPTGFAYAIPTKKYNIRDRLSLAEIKPYVDDFIKYAKDHPEHLFDLTKVGCGYAGYSEMDIAPLFKDCPDNVRLISDNGAIVCAAKDWNLTT